jgi:hypothetical protein
MVLLNLKVVPDGFGVAYMTGFNGMKPQSFGHPFQFY